MIAWFIRFGTAIFGDTNLGVRFAGILAMLVTQLLLADIVRRVTHDVRADRVRAADAGGRALLRAADGQGRAGHGDDPVRGRDAVVAGPAARERQCALVARRGPVRRAGAVVEIHRDHAAAGGAGVHAGAGLAAALAAQPLSVGWRR